MAMAAKLAANLTIAGIIPMISEAHVVAGAQGVKAAQRVELFQITNFSSNMMQVDGNLVAQRCFIPAEFPIRLGRKDVRLALGCGGDGAALPFGRMIAVKMDRISPREKASVTGQP